MRRIMKTPIEYMIDHADEAHVLSNKRLAAKLKEMVWAELNIASEEAALVEEAIDRLEQDRVPATS